MRKNLLSFLNVMMLCVMTFLASCSKDNDVEVPTPNPDPVEKHTTYTVMLYGCGGGDLDNALKYNLGQIEGLGKTSRVNFTGLVKFSKPYQTDPETEGTRLLTLTMDSLKSEKKYEGSYRLDNPEHLANFIKESKENFPADKYILVFWNHGTIFGPADKPVQSSYPEVAAESRAALLDDNIDNMMSTYEMEKGIKDSGTKLDLIYFDVCLTGMAETFYQLKDCAKYIMASSHNTPGVGCNYTSFLSDLQENDSLTDAIKAYVPSAVANWKNASEKVADLTCYDMQYMDEFAQHAKTAADNVLRIKKQVTEIPDGLSKLDERWEARMEWFVKTQYGEKEEGLLYVFDEEMPSVDMCSLLNRMAVQFVDGKLSSAATLLRRTVDKMTVASSSFGLPNWLDKVSMGVNWPTSVFVYKKNEKYVQALRSSAFCQATGWDKILLDTQNPEIAWINSAYGDAKFYYEGELSSYTYAWDVTVSADESQVTDKNREAVAKKIDALNALSAQALAGKTYPLQVSSDIMFDFYRVIYYKHLDALKNLGITKIKILAKLRDGQTVNPKDSDAKKYATSVEKEYDLE